MRWRWAGREAPVAAIALALAATGACLGVGAGWALRRRRPELRAAPAPDASGSLPIAPVILVGWFLNGFNTNDTSDVFFCCSVVRPTGFVGVFGLALGSGTAGFVAGGG